MRDTKQNDVITIDTMKLLSFYLRRWWIILICGIVSAVAAYFISSHFITPLYRAGVTIYVNNSRGGERADSITSSEMTASQQLVRTYVNIISSDRVLEAVIEAAELDCSAGELRRMMTTEQVSNTEIFKVYIQHPEPEKAAYIANAIADAAPAAIEEIVEGSSTKIVDYAKVPQEKFSPNNMRNTLLGGMIGGVLALAYLTVCFLLDVRIKDETDLTALSAYPILGQIPDFNQLGSHSGRYGYRYGYKSDESKKSGRPQKGGKA